MRCFPRPCKSKPACISVLFQAALCLALAIQIKPLIAATLQLDICYNYGCTSRGTVSITQSDLDYLQDIFRHSENAEEERESIQLAIASLERITGRTLPTTNDIGKNYRDGMVEEGQMDCIDESTNTSTYLTLLQQQGMLRWHTVEERAFRAPFVLDQHWTAQIRERESGERFVVDSWFEDNGEPPIIQPLDDWLHKRTVSR